MSVRFVSQVSSKAVVGILVLSGWVAVGCGGSDVRTDVDGADGLPRPDVASSSDARQRVDAWSARLEKNCVASDILREGGLMEGEPALDQRLLEEKLGDAQLVRGDGGTFYALVPGAPGPQEESSFESSGTNREDLKVRTTSDGTQCTVFINEEEVASRPLLHHVDVVAAWNPETVVAQKRVYVQEKVAVEPGATADGIAGFRSWLPQLLVQTTAPDFLVAREVSGRLGLSEASASLFRPALDRSPSVVWTFPEHEAVPPFFSQSPGGATALTNILAPTPLLARMVNEGSTFRAHAVLLREGTALDEKHAGHWTIELTVTTRPIPTASGPTLEYRLDDVRVEAVTPFSDTAAANCVTRVAAAVLDFRPNVPAEQGLTPAALALRVTCEPLTQNFGRALVKDDAALEQLRRPFLRRETAPADVDWAKLLGEITRELGDETGSGDALAESLRKRLKVDATTPVLERVALESSRMRRLLESQPVSARWRAKLYGMVTLWAFTRTLVGESNLNRAITAAARAFELFPVSGEKALDGYTRLPNDVARMEVMDFASAMDDEHLASSRKVAVEARAIGLEFWARSYENEFFQRRRSLQSIRDTLVTLELAKTFIERDKREGSSGQLNELVGRFLDEAWGTKEFELFESLAAYGRFVNRCDFHRPTSARMLCLNGPALTTTENGLLAIRREGRYGTLATAFIAHREAVRASRFWGPQERQLGEAFFTPIWSGCSNTAFDQKAAQLEGVVQRMGAATTYDAVLGREFDAVLANCAN